ncbi:MAG: DUF4065 domain-containing protein [Clostridia bacterium]|nr:DUF4065 domain-containing protein [Clostridia bacterium]
MWEEDKKMIKDAPEFPGTSFIIFTPNVNASIYTVCLIFCKIFFNFVDFLFLRTILIIIALLLFIVLMSIKGGVFMSFQTASSDASSVAKYIVSYCIKKNNPITNLKLQKMLYFLWVDYYKQTRKALFTDSFYAWQLGPVVPSVYFEYCSYGGMPIVPLFEKHFPPPVLTVELQNTLPHIMDKYIQLSARALVDKTHAEGTPWSIIFDNGRGNRSEIPFSLIREKEGGTNG